MSETAVIITPILALLFIFIIFAFISYIDSEHEDEIQKFIQMAEKPLIDQLDKVSTQWKTHTHDFHNHIEVLQTLLEDNKIEEAKSYMSSIHGTVGKLQLINHHKLDQPIVNALFRAKIAHADQLGIDLYINLEESILFPQLKSYDLTRLLGNLLDNALEALEPLPLSNRKLEIEYKKMLNVHVLKVKNSNLFLKQEDLQHLFKEGFSTKKNHSGTGLVSVNEIVYQYGGEISVSLNKGMILFRISIPE